MSATYTSLRQDGGAAEDGLEVDSPPGRDEPADSPSLTQRGRRLLDAAPLLLQSIPLLVGLSIAVGASAVLLLQFLFLTPPARPFWRVVERPGLTANHQGFVAPPPIGSSYTDRIPFTNFSVDSLLPPSRWPAFISPDQPRVPPPRPLQIRPSRP